MASAALLSCLFVLPAQAQIVLYVTGQPITAYDIEQRGKLIALGGKPKSRQEVIDELIDDKIKILAAKRFNFEMTQTEIDNAFANLARNAGASADQFSKMLESRGVNPNTLKARLKADLTWNQMVRGKFGQQLTPSERDIFEAEMKSTDQKEAGVEYTLHPITFVVPRGSAAGVIEARKREADALRTRFQSCSTGLPFARALREVVVRAPIRRNSADLSPALREILAKVEVGKVTPPEVTEGGVEVFALCDKKETNSDSPTKRKVRDEIFQRRFQTQADRYLKELRAQAMIEYKQ
ncbi:peptidylprolyl isomerase [Pseudorhodoplanes sp.]|uniref:peptidylprolyl isomerase n=1 Tax=Pseudorhodoplanes sp. TaxID=1934341 RepID=UPI002C33A6DA|nr:SurA N-terminal domain-containing protein [Pseudorhodoplanes sp.]HWV52248.1 SurA N-terminal domain-containing protein [Pseudorhodoplanes sp.]